MRWKLTLALLPPSQRCGCWLCERNQGPYLMDGSGMDLVSVEVCCCFKHFNISGLRILLFLFQKINLAFLYYIRFLQQTVLRAVLSVKNKICRHVNNKAICWGGGVSCGLS